MNKKEIILLLIETTKQNLAAALAAAKNTYEIATNEESKPENKYDTRGLEASYLAGAQAERVLDIKDTLASLESMALRLAINNERVALGSLVEILSPDKNSFVFVMPKGGGQIVNFENRQIQVITPDSPLGKNLIGKEEGELVEIKTGEKKRTYEILKIH